MKYSSFSRRNLSLLLTLLLLTGCLFAWTGIGRLQATDGDGAIKAGNSLITINASKQGNPHVNFDDSRELDRGENVSATQPVALVSADFDSDGVADVITADASGSLQLLKGIDPANFAIDPTKKEQARPEPFSAIATDAALGISPDYLFAGDFNADGKQDVLGAVKGANGIVVVIGDGLGHFSQPVNITVGGIISAVEAGEVGKPDGQADLAVTYSNKNGSFLAVYEHPESAFKHVLEIIKLPSAATSLAVGNMDEDFYSDIAVACGNELVIVHERGQAYPWDIVKDSGITRPPAVVETRIMSFTITSMAVGRFGEKRGTSLALLGGDGNIYNVQAPKTATSPGTKLGSEMVPELQTAPFVPAVSKGRQMAMISQELREAGETDAYGNPVSDASKRKDPAEMLADAVADKSAPKFDLDEVNRRNAADAPRKAAMQQRTKDAFIRGISAKTTSLAKWEIMPLTSDRLYAAIAGSDVKLTRASVSDSPFDDLIVTSPNSRRMDIVLRPRDDSGKISVQNVGIEGSGGIVAVLPTRLNLDGLNDLVVLRQGASTPSVLMTAPSATFVVNTTADDADCNFGGACSLRDAIRRANQIGGSSTIYFNISDTPSVISPVTPLPSLLQPITIQGSHQASGTKRIEINGQMAGTSVDGLKIRTSNSFIYDLAITGFKSQIFNGSQVGGNGIAIESDSARPNNAHNTVLECYLGIDVTGTTAKGNMAAGILIFDSDENDVTNSVGSGNNTGIAIEGGNTNSFSNNILGLNAAGSAKVPNFRGMFLAGADNRVGGDFAGAPNTISGNGVVSNIAACVGYGIVVPIFVDLTTLDLLSHDNSVVGNKLGTDPSGGIGLGNCWQGINAEPLTGTTIGSIAESGRNIISGNGLGGVWCEAVGNSNQTEGGFCSIMGNNVGTDITGSYSIYNDARNTPQISGPQSAVLAGTNYSVSAIGAPGGITQGGACTGFCNLVSGNSDGGSGIDLASGVMVGGPGIAGVFNNYVGTKRNGSQVLVNAGSGIDMASTNLTDASPIYYVGGHTDFDGSLGNLVSGNDHAGIVVGATIEGSPGEYKVQGNLIGTDLFGEVALPNGSGIFIGTGYINPVDIGDSDPLGRNVISGNAFNGINLFSGFGVKIVNNAIGANGSLAPLGNGGTGVNVGGYYASSIIVGGTDSTTSNIISNNGKSGVKVNGITSTFTPIRGNVIHNNGQLGIDLNQSGYFPDGDGVTPNDDCAKDADLGANRLQNYPVLFTPGYNPDGTVHVTGTLISTPFHHFRIDVYATLVADPSGHGEGQLFLGTAEVTLDGNGSGSIDWNSIGTAPNGAYISATATDDLGNTSEFSCNAGQSCDGNAAYKDMAEFMASAPLTCPASIVVNIDTDQPDVTGDQVCDVNTSNSTLDCSLRAALELVNEPSYSGPHTIAFGIPGSGVQTITPATPLPALTRQADIRGTTQPGWSSNSVPLIEISGVNQPSGGAFVLAAGSSGSTISGFTINRFLGDGITIESNSNSIENCFLGLNAAGDQVYANRQSPNGVKVVGSDNTIGGSVATSQNFIAGNGQNQVLISGATASGNNVWGNVIGRDTVGNIHDGLFSGVKVEGGSTNNRIGGPEPSQFNDIVGAKHAGIELVDGANSNFVLYNVVRRCKVGIAVVRSKNNTIGMTDPPIDSTPVLAAADNYIGIHIGDETPTYATTVAKNQSSPNETPRIVQSMSTDLVQTKLNKVFNSAFVNNDVNQSLVGVFVATATNTEIGGAGSGNVIDGNKYGVWLTYGAIKNTIRANTIGHDGVPNNNGMLIQGKENTIRNNTISENTNSGIVFLHISDTEFPTRNKVFSNYIGVNGGTVAAGNGLHGIELDGQDNDIGLSGQGNIISGNSNGCGIQIADGGDANRITGNGIGIGRDSAPLPNRDGVCVFGGLNRIVENTISGNSRRGVIIARDTTSNSSPSPRLNVLNGNRVGTNIDGDQAVPNGWDGILISDGAFENTIGGIGPNQGNVISGNRNSGILIGLPLASVPPFANEILGNHIGTNANGDGAIPNEQFGIVIHQSRGNVIGGFGPNLPGARNVISGNGLVGVLINGAGSFQNRVSGNYIGVGDNGTQPVGNGHNGIYIVVGAHDNIIGGTEPNAGNLIENNGRNGVALAPDAGTGNLIDPNTIAGNSMRGITLNETAAEGDLDAPPPDPVPNDQFDFDTGANKLQNYPDIATYNVNSGGDLIVSYRVDSSPGNSSYGFSEGIRVEFFKPDATGQGEKFLNSDQFKFEDFTASGNKTVNLGNAALMGFIVGDRITATATDFEGNTSEFSPVLPPTAANVTISGRVLASMDGRGVRGARLTLTDDRGNIRVVTSGQAGVYRFDNVETGRTYVIRINSRRFVFAPRVVQVNDNVEDLDFVPEP